MCSGAAFVKSIWCTAIMNKLDDQNQQAEKYNNSCSTSNFRYDAIVMLGMV